MVSLASVILVSGIGLAIFFREDIGKFLESLKGFGQVDISLIPEGAIPKIPPVPEMGVTGGLLDVLGGAGTAQGVFEAGEETRKGVDEAIFNLQQGAENLSQQVQTQIGEVQLGFQQTQTNIADFFTGISQGIFRGTN